MPDQNPAERLDAIDAAALAVAQAQRQEDLAKTVYLAARGAAGRARRELCRVIEAGRALGLDLEVRDGVAGPGCERGTPEQVATATYLDPVSATEPAPKKRRGRPPRVKPAVAEGTPLGSPGVPPVASEASGQARGSPAGGDALAPPEMAPETVAAAEPAPALADGTPLWHHSRLDAVLPGDLSRPLARADMHTLGDLDTLVRSGHGIGPRVGVQGEVRDRLLSLLAGWWQGHMPGYEMPPWMAPAPGVSDVDVVGQELSAEPEPGPEPGPEPAAVPAPAAGIPPGAWRDLPVTGLKTPRYVQAELARRGIGTCGQLADRFAATPAGLFPSFYPADEVALRGQVAALAAPAEVPAGGVP